MLSGLVMGLCAAAVAFAIICPLTGVPFSLGPVTLVGLLGSVFGIVAGTVAACSRPPVHPLQTRSISSPSVHGA